MWDVKACRGCLAVQGKLEKVSNGYKRLYTAITGVQIADGDGYPHYFCLECRVMMKKSLAFRRKSRRAHFVLKEIMSIRKQVSYSDIVTVNRKKTNLTSSLGFWEPQKTHTIIITENDEPPVDIEPTGPYYTRVVDIKPTNDTEEAEEANEPEDLGEPDPIEDNEDIEIKKELLEIDLNDVFKDLKEVEFDLVPSPEPDFADPEVKIEPPDIMSKTVDKLAVRTIINALEACDIKVLTLEQQIEIIEMKKRSEEFIHAHYKCGMCLTIHKTMDGLMEHVAYHNNRRFGHECPVCKNKYPTVEEMNIHIARCHMYEYKCKCNSKRYSLQEIVDHTKECNHLAQNKLNRLQRVKLLECLSVLPLTPALMYHVRQLRVQKGEERGVYRKPKIITEKISKCDICGKWFRSKPRLESHMLIKHLFMFTCKVCKEAFTDRDLAVKHCKTHIKEEVPQSWPCESCDAVFKDYRSLVSHCWKHTNKQHTCNICGHLFKRTRHYYLHQLTEHKYISLNDPLIGDPQHQCTDCGIQFVDKRSLDTHLVFTNHTGANHVEFACVPCKKIFENEDQLQGHYVTCKYPSKYPRKCCYCPEMLPDSREYQKHFSTEHPTLQYRYLSRSAICDVCGKLVQRSHLEAHLKQHTDDSLVCRHCGTQSIHPAVHLVHTLAHAGKPYRCALCPRRFQHKGDARDHILKVHAPTKLYKCEFCAQEFSYFRYLREHSEKLHNLIIPPVKNTKKKSTHKIYVYAHMRIEISEEERGVLEKTEVLLIDYLDQKTKPVDYKDYFIFVEPKDQVLRVKKKRTAKEIEYDNERASKKRAKQKKNNVETQEAVERVAPMNWVGETEIEGKELNLIDGNVHLVYRDTEDTRVEMETENAVQSIAEGQDLDGMGDGEMETQEMLIDADRPLEVFENDGNQFVMIGDELYRIAADDDE